MTLGQPPVAGQPADASDEGTYKAWRNEFARERLWVLYILGLIANPVFIASDFLLYRQHLISFLGIRAVLEFGLLVGFILVRQRVPIPPNVLLIFWIVFPNIWVTHMTMLLGGFTSGYYSGMNLVFLAAAVIVPSSWRSHLFAQAVTLTYYYVANFVFVGGSAAVSAAIENSFFLLWTCVALLFSVFLYERLQKAEFQARGSEQRARRELESSNAKLLELDRLKSEFFANVSHELRTPLTLILGAYRSLLKLPAGTDGRDIIQAGLRNTSRLLYLINELLDLARFEGGRAELRKQCIDFAALVRGVAANFESSERLNVHCRGVSDPIALLGDPRQLKKVAFNLLSNAFKFSDVEKGQVWIRLTSKADEVVLEVEDNGIGIPQDQLSRIFERFTQVEGSATRRYEGSGIGLALVQEIVTLHGGSASVTSEVGRGSTFTVILPRGNARPEDIVALDDEDACVPSGVRQSGHGDQSSEFPFPGPAAADRPLLLVAEDNPDMRGYLERVLKSQYRLVLAQDGAEGVELIKRRPPDLIITDAMMPRMSGYDLLKAVRAHETWRSIPVMFLTARAGTEAQVESFEAGADDYLHKPFEEAELLARVNNLIRGRSRERELLELQKQKLTRFLPPQLAELIATGRDDLLKSHRREITVLFIDLRGFTPFAETAEPEDLLTVLGEYHAEMGRLIFEYKGTLEHFAGDGLMVFFNDPLPVEHHAEVGVRMAIAMRERIAELRTRWGKRTVDLGAGIGIATGYATLGMIGFEGRQEYAAIGTVTNLAARLCGEAKQGQILVSGRCVELIEEVVCLDSVGEVALKGFHRQFIAYNVVGLKS